ncbi:hypothetical protein E3U55_17000 [Filobacillus milosensis]|uniref:Uncharacterized protein n=1 Tax=Filobacillus milosensis TaxID=94137 RepID=A0A4Y8ICQ2_9BACI|nr:hypothetical protein [Filobacillus milosensis]TFB12812.1 hypothetical protein E3U55_17000 [Filobacillus milosensis]
MWKPVLLLQGIISLFTFLLLVMGYLIIFRPNPFFVIGIDAFLLPIPLFYINIAIIVVLIVMLLMKAGSFKFSLILLIVNILNVTIGFQIIFLTYSV